MHCDLTYRRKVMHLPSLARAIPSRAELSHPEPSQTPARLGSARLGSARLGSARYHVWFFLNMSCFYSVCDSKKNNSLIFHLLFKLPCLQDILYCYSNS